jgi:hypothetical protein
MQAEAQGEQAYWEQLVNEDKTHQTPPWNTTRGFVFESKNVTSFLAHGDGLSQCVARLTLLQEHSIPERDLHQVRRRVRTNFG